MSLVGTCWLKSKRRTDFQHQKLSISNFNPRNCACISVNPEIHDDIKVTMYASSSASGSRHVGQSAMRVTSE